MSREQTSRSQNQEKPAASTERQRESRAAHATAKAMPLAQEKPDAPERLPGVGGATGLEGVTRNRRDPTIQPQSRRVVPYKPEVKAGDGWRESEGVTVCAEQRINQEGSSPSGSQMERAISKNGGNFSLAGARTFQRAGCPS